MKTEKDKCGLITNLSPCQVTITRTREEEEGNKSASEHVGKMQCPKASCVSKSSTAEMLSAFYLVRSNATAFTQFNYEPVSLGNSGEKEGLLIEKVLRDQLLVRPLKADRERDRDRERGEIQG